MELKTLGQMLQEIVENDGDRRFSLIEFLLESKEEDRKRVQDKLTDMDTEQFNQFMDGYNFVNRDEVACAVCEYFETVNCRSLSMGEMLDIEDIADDYIRDKGLEFEEE